MSAFRELRSVSPTSKKRIELGISRDCCRNLFGPVDHEQLRAELAFELKRIADEKKRQWNFDFEKVEPLEGDFLWQRIGENRSDGFTTNAASNRHVSERVLRRSSSHASGTTHVETNSNARLETSNAQTTCFKTPDLFVEKRRRKSQRITDYLKAKKRSSTSRKIKFTIDEAGGSQIRKRVPTRKAITRGQLAKQSTLERYLTKVRQGKGKLQSSR